MYINHKTNTNKLPQDNKPFKYLNFRMKKKRKKERKRERKKERKTKKKETVAKKKFGRHLGV